jgi:hypothetical protein
MGKLIVLANYRIDKKKCYMKKYETHISKFVNRFINHHVLYSFETISQTYISHRQQDQEEAWDYCDFRDILKDAMDEVFGEQIWDECQKHYWFDSRYITKDELIDRFISQLVLGPDVSALR